MHETTDTERDAGDEIKAIRARLAVATPGPLQIDTHAHPEAGCRCLSCEVVTGARLDHPDWVCCDEHPTMQETSRRRREAGRVQEDCPYAPIPWPDAEFLSHAHEDVTYLLGALAEVSAERDRIFRAHATVGHEVEQTLGKALGYPVMGPELFEDGQPTGEVCVGDHVPQTLAAEAADRIGDVTAERDRLRDASTELAEIAWRGRVERDGLVAEVERLRAALGGLLDVLQQPMQAASDAHLTVQVAGEITTEYGRGRAHVLDDLHRRVDAAYLAGREALTPTPDEAAPDA